MGIICSIFSDMVAILILETILAGSVIVSAFKNVKKPGNSLSVTRGETSMAFVFSVYGILSIFFASALSVTESFKGYKVFLLLVDYVGLAYLFFFNSWFRNICLFRLRQRVYED